MTTEMLKLVLRSFNRRRPFLPFLIDFNSGDRVLVTHPEAIDQVDEFFVHRAPNRVRRVFVGSSVCQLLDATVPSPAS